MKIQEQVSKKKMNNKGEKGSQEAQRHELGAERKVGERSSCVAKKWIVK